MVNEVVFVSKSWIYSSLLLSHGCPEFHFGAFLLIWRMRVWTWRTCLQKNKFFFLGWLHLQTHYSKLLLTLSLDITNSVRNHFIVCGGCLTLIKMSCHNIQGTSCLKCLLSFANKITAVQILQDKDLKEGSSGNSGPTLGSRLGSPSFPEQPPSWSLLYIRTKRWWQPTDLEKWKKKKKNWTLPMMKIKRWNICHLCPPNSQWVSLYFVGKLHLWVRAEN